MMSSSAATSSPAGMGPTLTWSTSDWASASALSTAMAAPVSIAALGMPSNAASAGSSTSTSPPMASTLRTPREPSEPLPDRITAIERGPWKSASDTSSRSIGKASARSGLRWKTASWVPLTSSSLPGESR
jgi:hypothetical protein